MKAGKLVALLIAVSAACGAVHADEGAQAQIVRPQPDSNGVDLVTGGLYVPEPGFEVPGAGKMQVKFGRTDTGNEISRLRIGLSSFVVDPDPNNPAQNWPRMFTATVNGVSSRFMCYGWGGCDEYAPKVGATLDFVGGYDPTLVTYTAGDGTSVKFPVINYQLDYVEATEVLYPSGEKLSIVNTHSTPWSTVVTSNLGYTASMVASGPTETRRMYKGGTSGTLLNTITTGWQDIGPQGSTYTRNLTDDLGRITRIHYERVVSSVCWFGASAMSLKWFEDPSGLRTSVDYHRVGVPNTSPFGIYGNLVVNTIARNGKTWSYSGEIYNGTTGFPKLITDPTGAVREVISNGSGYYGPPGPYDPCGAGAGAYFGNILSDKTPLGRTTSYVYNDTLSTNWAASDYLAGATLPEGNKFAYEYDERGNVTKTTQIPKSGGAGKVTYQASYPATCSNLKTCNQPTWTRDAVGSQTDFTYDATHGGLLTKLEPVDANGKRRKTWNEYEAYNTGNGILYRLSAAHLCSVLASGANVDCQTIADRVTRYTYWGSTLLPLTETRTNGTNSLSATTTYTYDNWGRVLSVVDPTGVANYFRYDVMGRKTWEISPNGAGGWVAKKYTYDVADQITRVDRGTLPDPASTALQIKGSTINSYDVEHRLTKVEFVDATYGRSSVQQLSYNAVSRLVCSVKRMNPSAFDLTSDACTVGPAGTLGPDRVTKLTYNLDGRATKIVEGFGVLNGGQGIVSKETDYTNNGNVKWVKDGNGNQTNYVYDDYDRQYRSTFADSTFEQSEYDSANRLWRFTKRGGQYLTHGYDGASRLTSTSFSNGEPAITRDYDGQGRATTISRAGQSTTYTYGDALGRLSSESQPAGNVSYAYDLADHQTRITWPGNYWVDYDFNSAGSLWRVRELGATAGLGVVASWTFDGLGRRATLSRGNGAVTTLTRDADDQLLSLAHDFAGTSLDVQRLFERNPASQITARTNTNSAWEWTQPSAANVGYVPDVLNRYSAVGGVTFSYDGNGNLTYDGSRTYGYDFANHLTAASGGGAPTAALAYDPQGRLYSVASNGVTTRYLYDGKRLIAAYDGSGNLMQRYVPGVGMNMPLLSLTGAATAANSASTPNNANWLVADERSSVIALTNASGTPAINKYGPYGEPHPSNQGQFGYTGQLWIPAVGLYHYRARDYHPGLGRFMQMDPIGYGDGLNLYAYVRNDPLNYLDPTGTESDMQKQAEEERQRLQQQEAEKKKAADAQTAQQQSTEPQKVVQPKDSPYEEDGVTLKPQEIKLNAQQQKEKAITEAITNKQAALNKRVEAVINGNEAQVRKLEHQAARAEKKLQDLVGVPERPPLLMHADGSTGGDIRDGDKEVPQ